MKIEMKESNTNEDKAKTYPILMRNTLSGVIWLAIADTSGILIHDPNGYADAGAYVRMNLIPFSDTTWEPLPPASSVTFTQE